MAKKKKSAAKKKTAKKSTSKKRSQKADATNKRADASQNEFGSGVGPNYQSVLPEVAYEHACQVSQSVRDEIEQLEGVISVAVGRRQVRGEWSAEWAIQILAETSEAKAKLVEDAKQGQNVLQPFLHGVPTDIVVIGESATASGIGGGLGISSFEGGNKVGSGTLGLDFLLPNLQRVWLTAAHVAHPDKIRKLHGQRIMARNRLIGTTRHSDVHNNSMRNDDCDYAVIFPESLDDHLKGFLPSLQLPNPDEIRPVTFDDLDPFKRTIWTVGQQSNYQEGKIISIDHPVVPISLSNEKQTKPILISPGFARPGDSGAIVVSSYQDDQGHPRHAVIGMVRAVVLNGPNPGMAIVTRIEQIQTHIDLLLN